MACQLAAGRGKARGGTKSRSSSGRRGPPRARVRGPRAEREEAEQADQTTRKYGLEAGLWSVFRSSGSSQSRADQAKELLKVGSQGMRSPVCSCLADALRCAALLLRSDTAARTLPPPSRYHSSASPSSTPSSPTASMFPSSLARCCAACLAARASFRSQSALSTQPSQIGLTVRAESTTEKACSHSTFSDGADSALHIGAVA
jgi:hypothetical protein